MKKPNYIPKEISWMSFNERVLQEANNPDVPLIERLRFLGIYSNNLNEFFRVRVATLRRFFKVGKKSIELFGAEPMKILERIKQIVMRQNKLFESIFTNLLKELAHHHILLLDETKLNPQQELFIRKYFRNEVHSHLMPVMINKNTPPLTLKDDALYYAVSFHSRKESDTHYAIMEIPSRALPRFIRLPQKGNNTCYILLDDVVRYGLKDVFYMFTFDAISAYAIKLTRDAELDIDDDISESYVKNVMKSLKKRKEGNPVMLMHDERMPEELLKLLIRRLNFRKEDTCLPTGRYQNFKDFINFSPLNHSHLRFPPFIPILPKKMIHTKSILESFRSQDNLLYFPYHSFDHFIDLLREASIDTKVTSIQITLYRVANQSKVIRALINALRNGKSVTAIIELQARFSEEANINWFNKLMEEGAHVIYGVPNLKVHAKLCLITRREEKKEVLYACVGTGNFNEDTSKTFCDMMLLTAEKKITHEISKLFIFFKKNYTKYNFKHLSVSPFNLRSRMLKHIRNEIKNAEEGKPAYIYIKVNNLTDPEIIEAFYKASSAGVKIRLNVRGMFSLKPGIVNVSENIKAIGIVDQFLEHTRIFIFCNNQEELYFITSSDLMTRNLDRRVEVTCPVYDKTLQKILKKIMELQWSDNMKARELDTDLQNRFRKNSRKTSICSQSAIYEYLKNN